MTLDEAIRHSEEIAEENYGKATAYLSDREVYKYEEQKCLKCADEHMQLADWLRDYKRLKEQERTGHWIVHEHAEEFYGGVVDNYECDNCGDWYLNKTNFCPNCGCNMSENPTGSKPEISSYYGLKSYVRERSDK